MTDTTIHVREADVRALDAAASEFFNTTEVPRRLVVKRLIDDHDALDVTVGDGDE